MIGTMETVLDSIVAPNHGDPVPLVDFPTTFHGHVHLPSARDANQGRYCRNFIARWTWNSRVFNPGSYS